MSSISLLLHRSCLAQVLTNKLMNFEMLSAKSSTNVRCFLEQETLPLLLITG